MDHNKKRPVSGQSNNGSGSEQRPLNKQDAPANLKSGRSSRFPDSGSGSRRRPGQDFPVSSEFRGGHPKQRGGHNQIKRPPPKTRPDDNNTSMTQADEFEVGSVFNHGSKKQNLNHLLNFQFEPRAFAGNNTNGSRNNPHKRNEPMMRRTKFSKEQYLQANCQFVVREGEDYDVHLVDADIPVDWNLIEQVVLKSAADVPSCPICLYPPTAAKITRCGHVFCWSCILHYLSLSDHTWRKCPICYEAIYRKDLKSVISVAWKEFHVGEEIEMHLMRRDRNSLFALPIDEYFPEVNQKHPNITQKNTYSQLVTASPAQVAANIVARERFELENQYRIEGTEPEACFIEEALQYISERENGIVDLQAPASDEFFDEQDEDSSPGAEDSTEAEDLMTSPEVFVTSVAEVERARPRHESSSSDGTTVTADLVEEVTAEDLDISRFQPSQHCDDSKNGSSKAPKATFYFYQSSDGQPIFLHAVNVQMLVRQFGSFESCPKVIRGKILEKDSTSMTSDLRNKLRYLKHLPLTSTFEVCELEMRVPRFSADIVDEFKPQLEARRKRRQRRARDEKRRDKAITIEMNKQMGKYPGMKLRIESDFHFPQFGSSTSQALARSSESVATIDSTLSCSPPAPDTQDKGSGISFAKMLREGAARGPRPVAPPVVHRSETFPVLGAISARAQAAHDSDPDPEDYVPPPPKASMGDLLAQALERSTIKDESSGSKPGKKGKKMKGQKICLTGGRMNIN